MTVGKSRSSLLDGAVLPVLLRFSAPVFCALFLQALYGAVDLWAVGRFCGEADVSAVATGSQTMLIATALVAGLSVGSTVLLGKKVGEQDEKGAADTVGTGICVFAVIGGVLSVVLPVFAGKISVLMNVPAAAQEKTVCYITVCGAGSIFVALYNLISAVFRGMGNSKTPLLLAAASCAVNIAGDILLIKVFDMGTSGAAAATVSAQAAGVIFSIVLIRKKGLPFAFGKENLCINKKLAVGIVKIGFPVAFQDMCNEISYLILIGFANTLGLTASAGVGVAEKLAMFGLLVPMSHMQSVCAFTAQNIGAGQGKRAKKSIPVGLLMAALSGGIIFCLVFFFGDVLSGIFTNEQPVINAAYEFLKATAIECFILCAAYCFTGYYNGLSKTGFVMVQGLCSVFLVKIPFAYFASAGPEPQLFQIGMSCVYSAAFTLLFCMIYYIYINKKQCRKEKI